MGLSDEAYVYVTTTGRTSGLPRQIEIWFVAHLGNLHIFAEHFEKAHWVKNILKNPPVKVRLGTQEVEATARPLEEESDSITWNAVRGLPRANTVGVRVTPSRFERIRRSPGL